MRTAKNCSGALIVDAAVCLPVFLLAMGLLLILIMQAGTEETLVRSLVSAGSASVKADAAGDVLSEDLPDMILEGGSFTAALHICLAKEWDEGPSVHVIGFLTDQKAQIAGNVSIDQLNWATVSCSRKALFSLPGTDGIRSVRSYVFRPWRGESKQLFDADDERVYVFPKYGEKYHIPGCSLIKQYPANYEAVSISEAEERGFGACKLCVGGLHTFEPGHGGGLQ